MSDDELKPLSIKQQKTANNYLKGNSMKKSMILGGYSESYAHTHCAQFLKNRSVMAYVRKRQQDEADVALADAILVKKKLLDLLTDPDAAVRLAALKQLDAHNKWVEELEAKLCEIENKLNNQEDSTNINIIFEKDD